MHFFPILSTLRRHRTAAILIVLEIALTCAIVCNAIFVIGDRLARMDRPSGIVEDELVRVSLTGIGQHADATAVTTEDLRAFAAIPGVKAAAAVDMVPFGHSSWNADISTIPDDPTPPINAAMYMGTPGLVDTLGVTLIAGRDFTPAEFQDYEEVQKNPNVHVPAVIITRDVAERMFPGKSALGQGLYITDKQPQIVVGVIERLVRPNDGDGPKTGGYSMILPIRVSFATGGNYLLRVDPSREQEILASIDATLNKVDPNRIILERQTYAELRKAYFKQDRAMAYLLAGVSVALLIITALGVVGLASFWVQQRTRQIGIRRALGATRGDILRYFQMENFILATVGIIVGMGLAYAMNLWLMDTYQVERLPAAFLPIGAALLWALGQIAVLGPAMRASLIPPAIATRSV